MAALQRRRAPSHCGQRVIDDILKVLGRLATLGLLVLAAGCDSGNNGAAPDRAKTAPTTITALIWAPDWPQEMQEIAAAFTRAHPGIKVDVQFMIGNSVEENLKPKEI